MSSRPLLPNQLNICLVARKFPILGRAADYGFLWPIARGLAQKGHRVTVLSSNNPQGVEYVVQDDVHAHFLQEGARYSRRPFPDLVRDKFLELHQKEPFHILHAIDSSAIKVTRNSHALKIATAYDVEATQMSQLFSIFAMGQETLSSLLITSISIAYKFLRTFYGRDRQLLRGADGVFVTSPQQRIVLERYYLYPDARIHTVPYGIEIGDLSPREKSDDLRAQLGIPTNGKVVVTISDMTELQEIKNLLAAFEKVAIKKPSARLIIVGYGPRFKEVEYEMLQLALGGRVILTGAVKTTELPDYISLSDVYVNISSRTSGFEPSILEAMAQRKVIIGSEVSPVSTIVEDGKEGFLIRPADVSTLASLLIQIFEGQLPSQEIGESARRKILDLFDMEKMVEQTIDAYYKILKSTGYYRSAKWKIW